MVSQNLTLNALKQLVAKEEDVEQKIALVKAYLDAFESKFHVGISKDDALMLFREFGALSKSVKLHGEMYMQITAHAFLHKSVAGQKEIDVLTKHFKDQVTMNLYDSGLSCKDLP